MTDLVFIAIIAAFFIAGGFYTCFCEGF